jgi:hypothetical protein
MMQKNSLPPLNDLQTNDFTFPKTIHTATFRAATTLVRTSRLRHSIRDSLSSHTGQNGLGVRFACGGNARKYSDLDLVILGSEPLSNDLYDQLVADFDDSDLPIRVDLLDWNRIDDSFKPYILEQHVVLPS